MTLGVLMAENHWSVVRPTLKDVGVPVEWVCHDVDQALSLLSKGGLRALWVEAHPDFLTPEIVGMADRGGIKVLALLTHPGAASLADARGVGHRVSTPIDLLEHLGVTPAPISRPPQPQAQAGTHLAVWGPTGAPGRTTVAITVAALLARRGFHVGLVDADPRGGAVSAALGLLDDVPGWFAACRLARKGELTASQCERLATWYRVGSTEFPVLTGLTRQAALPEPGDECAVRLLEATGQWREVVVWDCGSDLPGDEGTRPSDPAHDFTQTIVSRSDYLVAVCRADPIGVARFGRVWSDVRLARGDRPSTVVVNGVNTARRALKEESALREALRTFADVTHAVAISRDDEGVRQALMGAVTLVDLGGKQPVVESLRPFVESLHPVPRETSQSTRTANRRPTRAPGRTQKGPQVSLPSLRVLWGKLTALR